jgi:hypothetical protein
MQTNEYDVNTYVLDKIVYLYAYRMGCNEDGDFVSTDTSSDPVTLAVPIDTEDLGYKELIRFVLDSEYFDTADEMDNVLEDGETVFDRWEEYDSWTGTTELRPNADGKLAMWLDSLPFYDAPVTAEAGML